MEINIIIAENQKLFRDVLNSTLKSYGITTIAEAENGMELCSLLQAHCPDMVLLDIEMPVMSGDRVLKLINTEYPWIRIIILSQYDEQELIMNYLVNGASAYIHKGADVRILVEAIHAVKEKGFYHGNVSDGILSLISKQSNASQHYNTFSKREAEIIPLICEGKSNKAIASELNIVVKTVEAHRKNIYKKTQARSSAEFIMSTVKRGFSYFIK